MVDGLMKNEMFCQITEKFEEVMAVASSPRPSRKLYFEHDENKSDEAKKRYDSGRVIFNFNDLQYDPESISHLTFCDALHVIVAVFQSKPLTLKFLAMKKVLELDLEVEDLPQQLQVKAGEVDRLDWLD